MVSRPSRRAACGAALAVLAASVLLGHPRGAAAQTGTSPAPLAPSRTEPPPAAAPPPDGPAAEAPAPSDANLAPPAPISPLPAAPPSTVSEASGATDLSTPVEPTPEQPFYQKWWFWTAVGAFAVTAVVIVLASSDSGAPRTNLGNMPAF
jgi:hypothetical protein